MKRWHRLRPWRGVFHRIERQSEQIDLAQMVLDHLDSQAAHVERMTDELSARRHANHFREMFEEALRGRRHDAT